MADKEEVLQALLDRIAERVPKVVSEANAAEVRNLAEAWAWLVMPGQPHGGSATIKSG